MFFFFNGPVSKTTNKCIVHSVLYAIMNFDWQSHLSFLHPDCCCRIHRLKITDHRFLIEVLALLQPQYTCNALFNVSPHVPTLQPGWFMYSEYHFVWLTVMIGLVVSRSERPWPRVNGPILTCLLHGEHSLAPSSWTWGSVCKLVRRHRFQAPAQQLAAVNISFSNERGHPQIFKGRNWAACFFI